MNPRLVLMLRKKGFNVEVMSTEHAISTFNYLCAEDRLVCAALIPPKILDRAPSDQDIYESNRNQRRDKYGDFDFLGGEHPMR